MGVPPPRACMPLCQGECRTVQFISIIMWKIPFHQSHYHPWRMKKLESHLLQLEEIHDEAGELNKKYMNIADNHNTITVKPVLSGHHIKRTPSIKRTVSEVPKFISLINFK